MSGLLEACVIRMSNRCDRRTARDVRIQATSMSLGVERGEAWWVGANQPPQKNNIYIYIYITLTTQKKQTTKKKQKTKSVPGITNTLIHTHDDIEQQKQERAYIGSYAYLQILPVH